MGKRIFKSTVFKNIVAFLAFFGVLLALVISFWVKQNFTLQHFGQVLFHLTFPLVEMGEDIPKSFLLFCLPPSFLLSFLMVFFLRQKTKMIVLCWGGLFFLSVYCINHNLKITDYLQSQREFSLLYETHYQFPQTPPLKEPARNLVVILMESMSAAFSNVAFAGGGHRWVI